MKVPFRFNRFLLPFLFVLGTKIALSQTLAPGTTIIEDYGRRSQLIPNDADSLKPIGLRPDLSVKTLFTGPDENSKKIFAFSLLPVQTKMQYNSKRPFGYGNFGMHNGRGYEQYLTGGGYARVGFLHVQLQPEFTFAQKFSVLLLPISDSYSESAKYLLPALLKVSCENRQQFSGIQF